MFLLVDASVERVFAEDEIDEIRPEENIGEHKSGWKTGLYLNCICLVLLCSTISHFILFHGSVTVSCGFFCLASEADDDQHTIQMDKLQDLLGNSDPQKFETEVNRIMKLIINSLYRNKEVILNPSIPFHCFIWY